MKMILPWSQATYIETNQWRAVVTWLRSYSWQMTDTGFKPKWSFFQCFSGQCGFYFKGLLMSGFGEGNGTPLQYSCLENPMDGGAWWATVHGVTKSRTWLKRLSSSSSNEWLISYFVPRTRIWNWFFLENTAILVKIQLWCLDDNIAFI